MAGRSQGLLFFPVFKPFTGTAVGRELAFQPRYRRGFGRQLVRQRGRWKVVPAIPFSDDTPNYDPKTPAPSP
ncbi:ABC transporter permease, partial [Pseudomonas syringae]